MKKIRAMLFDADGVLLFHTDKLFSDRLAEELGISPAKILPFFEEVYVECLVGKQDLKRAIEPYAKSWGWNRNIDELLAFWFDYERKADEPLLEYIAQLKSHGIMSYIATNNEKYRAQDMFSKLGFTKYFEGIYAAGTIRAAKPDPQFFERIYQDMPHLHRSEILFWDDSLVNVAAAEAFGFQAELYSDFAGFKERMKHYVS
jgi:putative hydrolase of the HAD superfamily